jgi:hypothetical protein
MFNPSLKPAKFRIPRGPWRVRLDTACPTPQDARDEAAAEILQGPRRRLVKEKSLVVLSRRR